MKLFVSQLLMLTAFAVGCLIARHTGSSEVMASGVMCAVFVLAAYVSQMDNQKCDSRKGE